MPKTETIDILSERLPIEIRQKTDFDGLINDIDSEELKVGLKDISRELFFRHGIEFYDISSQTVRPIAPGVDTEIATPNFKEIEKEEGKGFKIEKKEWIKKVVRGMVNSIISNVIERYGTRFGVGKPPGDNTGSIEWLIRVLRITLIEIAEECPEFVRAEIERLERRKLRVREEVAKMIDVEIAALKIAYNCE